MRGSALGGAASRRVRTTRRPAADILLDPLSSNPSGRRAATPALTDVPTCSDDQVHAFTEPPPCGGPGRPR